MAGLLCLFSGFAAAQGVASVDPLGLPEQAGPLICQNVPAEPEDASRGIAFTIRMTHGVLGVFVRSIVAAYDSSGRPLALGIAAEMKAQADTSHVFAVQFGPNATVEGSRALASNMLSDGSHTEDSTAGEPRLLSPLSRLSDDEKQRARRLADWVWERRCKKQLPPINARSNAPD